MKLTIGRLRNDLIDDPRVWVHADPLGDMLSQLLPFTCLGRGEHLHAGEVHLARSFRRPWSTTRAFLLLPYCRKSCSQPKIFSYCWNLAYITISCRVLGASDIHLDGSRRWLYSLGS